MRVGIEGLRDIGMAEALTDGADRHTGGEEMACMAVAQRMDRDLRQAGCRGTDGIAAVNRALCERGFAAEEERRTGRERIRERSELIAQL